MTRFLILLFLIFTVVEVQAQENKETGLYKLGVHYGFGSVNNIIFKDDDYFYEVLFHKIQIHYLLKSGKFDFELLLQPEINRAKHELRNRDFIRPGTKPLTGEEKSRMDVHTFPEYVINVGILIRKSLLPSLSGYFLASIGPGYFPHGTERMARGVGFSDNLALGLTWQFSRRINLESRFGFRHVSNAKIAYPNEGYDTVNLDVGLSYNLN